MDEKENLMTPYRFDLTDTIVSDEKGLADDLEKAMAETDMTETDALTALAKALNRVADELAVQNAAIIEAYSENAPKLAGRLRKNAERMVPHPSPVTATGPEARTEAYHSVTLCVRQLEYRMAVLNRLMGFLVEPFNAEPAK